MPAHSGIHAPDIKEFTARLGSESVTFVFDAAKMTMRRDKAIKNAARNDDEETMAELIAEVIVSWDVTDEAGAPLPFTADELLDLSASALGRLLEGLTVAAQPSDAEGEVSSGPSSLSPPAASTVSTPPLPERSPALLHQNGEAPSPSPAPSASPSPT